MRVNIFLFTLILSNSITCFSQNIYDTIYVEINLSQLDSNGLEVQVFPPSNFESPDLFCFPRTVPGVYEYLNQQQSLMNLYSISSENDTIVVSPIYQTNFFPVNDVHIAHQLKYNVNNSVKTMRGVYAEDTYYVKDSIYILNWHYILGFFKNNIDFAYKIEVQRNSELWGAGTLRKEIVNDSIDRYYASDYASLIDYPIVYSKPDTISFTIQDTRIMISTVGADDSLRAEDLKKLLTPSLEEAIKTSEFLPEQYSMIYFSDYYINNPYLAALEHPNSTIVCYHSALSDNNIIIESSIHEFCHALYTPLRIRSEVINELDLISPECDKYLWFYEGVTEYLSIKTLLYSGDFTHEDFLNELMESDEYQKNINFSKASKTVYTPKGQNLFDSFYTKGSLFALLLDLEILKLSNGKTSLFDIMNKLQREYNLEKPFNSIDFIQEFSKLSEVDIQEFIEGYVNHKKKINFQKIVEKIGYSSTVDYSENPEWTFDLKKNYWILNFRENKIEVILKRSLINRELDLHEVKIKEIDGELVSYLNYLKIYRPKTDRELSLLINNGGNDELVRVKPIKMVKKRKESLWTKNDNYEEEYLRKFWGEE